MKLGLNEPFLIAYEKIKALQEYDRYQAAYIFGSLVRGEQTKDSDLDVMVITNVENDCKEINHPVINGIKLDITFRSFKQIEKDNLDVASKNKRIPMIAESIILLIPEELGGLPRGWTGVALGFGQVRVKISV